MRVESYSPPVNRVHAGAFEQGGSYATYRTHGTTDWLLIHTVSGRGRFGSTIGIDFHAQPGDSTLLQPGALHDYGVEPEPQRWEIAFAHFHPRPEWLPLLDWPQLAPGLSRIHSTGEIERRITENLRQAARFTLSGVPRNELFALNCLEATILWCDTQNPLARRIDERVQRVIEHIDRHLDEPLDPKHLAHVAQLSVSRFTHLFTESLGTSPRRYVDSQRLTMAMQLLDLTSRSVAAIAREVGYRDPLYFSTRFKRHTGLSPTAYRERA